MRPSGKTHKQSLYGMNMKDMNCTPEIDSSERQCFIRTSQTTNAINPGIGGGVSGGGWPISCGKLILSGQLPPTGSSSHSNIFEPQVIGSQPISHDVLTNKEVQSGRQPSLQIYRGLSNSSLRSQTDDDHSQSESIGRVMLGTSDYKGSSLPISTLGENIPEVSASQQPVYTVHSEAIRNQLLDNQGTHFVDMTQDPLRSSKEAKLAHGNGTLPCKAPAYPYFLSSQDFTFLGPSQLRTIDKKSNQYGGNYARNNVENDLTEVKECVQTMKFVKDGNKTIGTNDAVAASAFSEKKNASSFWQISGSERQHENYQSSSVLGAHLRYGVEDQNGPTAFHQPLLAEFSDSSGTGFENEGSNNGIHVSKNRLAANVEKEVRLGSCPEKQKYHSGAKTDTSPPKGADKNDTMLSSLKMEKKSKSAGGKITPFSEQLWDGALQLNATTTVSVVAFFKSGEKGQHINWSKRIEVKGKVRLPAFETYIQELPRCRTRALMVISLCWKAGSSKNGLKGMKQIAKGYKDNERVGVAQICPNVHLYVCPRSDVIITILAKYGFFKGMAAVEEDQDSFIGCVVWRKNVPALMSIPKAADRKKNPSSVQVLNSPNSSAAEMNSPVFIHDSENKQDLPPMKEPDVGAPKATESKKVLCASNSCDTANVHIDSIPARIPCFRYSSPVVPVEQPHEKPTKSIQNVKLRKPEKNSEAILPTLANPSQILPQTPVPTMDSNQPALPGPHSVPPEVLLRILQSASDAYKVSIDGISKAESPVTNSVEPKTAAACTGLPSLPTEYLQRLLELSRGINKDLMESASEASRPVMTTSELKRANKDSELARTLPRPAQLLQQAVCNSALPAEDDDLPEFDFTSACGVSRAPLCKASCHNRAPQMPNVPSFSKQIADDIARNDGKPELMQRLQTSAFQETTHPLSRLSSSYTEKGSLSPRHSFSFSRNVWNDDDEDDMPEWHPPRSSPTRKPVSEIAFPASSPISFRLPGDNDIIGVHERGILGKPPISDHHPAALAQRSTPSGTLQSRKLSPTHYGSTRNVRPRNENSHIKSPPGINHWRSQRP